MSWLVYRWLLLFVFNKGCHSFFLRHVPSGRCITRSDERVLNVTSGLPYYVVMTDNCLNVSGQFRYRDNEMLHHIETGGTLEAPPDDNYHSRWAVYKGVSTSGESYRLKQTVAGSLQFYQRGSTICAEPSKPYVMSKTYCDKSKQQFTFGSVTNYGAKMENVHCSSIQRMAFKRADYGDFNNNDVFDGRASIDSKCSSLSSCQVRSRCGGKKSCALTMGSNLLPSPYCRDTSKEIYTEYTCVENSSSNLGSNIITAATKMRLSYGANEGYIQVEDDSTWRYVKEEHWDQNRQKMLCQHLGFKETDANYIYSNYQIGRGYNFATGSLICYNTRPSETSCCIHLVPSTSTSNSKMTRAKCKICDKPLSLSDDNKFPPIKVFLGSGGIKYGDVRSTRGGWCASGSTPYLLLDLQKEYHLTHVMVIADKEQTKWSNSYSTKYSRTKTLIDSNGSIQIIGNKNGYQASITQLDRVYNARYVKIQSTRNTAFCLRIELCGEVQTPAAVNNLRITSYKYAAYVTWGIRTAPEYSSYITKIIIYIDGSEYQTISQRQRTYIVIKRFKPNTRYKVEIQTEDSYQQKSEKVSESFTTNTAGKICDKPLLQDTRTFPDNVFSGSGGPNYPNARLTKTGWCASGSRPYLSINLQKEYHLTQVVVITDKTQRSSRYSLTYGRTETWINSDSPIQITENHYTNGYQPFIKQLNGVYNARYVKIQSTATRNIHFCLRIELCGEVQTPAPVNDIKVSPSNTSAQVTLGNTAPETSSYITHYYIKLNEHYLKTIRRQESRTEFRITGLTPFTKYTVTIYAGDGSSQQSSRTDKVFTTNAAVPSEAPGSVAFTKRSKEQLTVSWSAPSRNSQNGELTGYRVCYSEKARSSSPSCSPKNAQSYTAEINNLQSATKYFVTVAARTTAGYGPKSEEISKITNGERVDPVATSYSSLNITITKPATYIKEVMIIVKDAPKNRGVEEIGESDLKPYDANTRDPYVTAYLKVDDLPETFMIGDGKEYNSKIQKYLNQPLKQNSSYIVFLRFFESQVSYYSYYSTQWSKVVKTFAKPPAPVNLNFFSTGPKKYTISWTQPFLPDQTRVLKYHGNYSASQGISKTLSISAEMRSVTIDVEFDKQYMFEIQVETRAGRSNVTSKSWTSHSAPLKPLNITDGYKIMLRKPKEEQKIKTVALVILQLQSKSNKPPAPENLNVENSPPSDTKANNVVFIAKRFNITEFQNDTIEIFLRESKGNRRRKRNAVDVYTLIPDTTYRIAQMNTDGLGNPFWSYWSDSFTFAAKADDDNSGDPGKRDDGVGSVGAAVGASFAVVVIIVAVVLAFIFFRRRRAREQHEDEDKDKYKEMKRVSEDEDNQEGIYLNENDDVEENVHPPVPIAQFAHYVNEMKANENYEFQKEYDDLPSNTNTAWEVAKKPFNKQKNRYGNIVTYDHCRVVLSGDEKEDYINASYIDGIKENAYIATQGPTLITLNDMWRMVWEQRSYSIVMVTSLVELEKPKCEKYWPDEGTEKFGDIEVTLMKIEEFAYHVTHTLQLKKDGEEREVRHYYFQSWPDHGVPKYPTQILAFRRHFRTHHMEQSGPIIVHCSAGVGRTGVFLATDTILDKLEKGVINSIDVFGQVCAIRERRMFMVQTLAQYIFVHEAILETILCGMNEVDSTNVQKEIETLAEAKENGMTGFQEKFKRLGEVSPKLSPDECAAALLKGNRNKNRNKDIYPAECNRVPLQSVDGVENSDYINAVFVQGYLGRDYFIATQSPLPNTINDFWRLVHLQKSSTIVLLNNVKDGTSFPKFWPTNRGESKQYDSLTVQLDSEKHSDGIWTRKFILSPHPDLSDGQVVNIFHYTKWPDHQVPPNADAVITLTSLVENSIKNYGPGPVIVACSDGAGRTGTYIAISNLLERMKIEQAMDVFQAIKIIRGTRPQFVENAEQYEFCYTAIMAYLDGFSDYANFE